MSRAVCIHGHFYQPPRENPWLEAIERQDSAAPYHDWNARITADCYAPNAHARILDAAGLIASIRNNYARISFNFGPTLLSWLEQFAPEVYAAIQSADRDSHQHFGQGSAIAQAYNHMILPLADARDRHTQVNWGVRDFRHRFGRAPEGMWLPETAANLASLEALAEAGIRFTILAPAQARRVRRINGRNWKDVSGGTIDPSKAYFAVLPSGRELALFFYDGPIAQAVAFEGLLRDGGHFAARLLEGFDGSRSGAELVHIATDGESYGHHHRFGEMALAYALERIAAEPGVELTNYAAFLAAHPPQHEVEIWENSSWSCVHGIERWRSDCGCNSGGHPGWNQQWRAPLRQALDWLRDRLAPLYEREAATLLTEPWRARDAYIDVVLERDALPAFLEHHARAGLSGKQITRALELLEMQRHAMLMYTSCGWFFDEVSGIETVQVLQYAGRALQLAQKILGNGADVENGFLRRLEAAPSNLPEQGNGRQIFEEFVRPAVVTLAQVGAHYAVSSLFEDYGEEARVYGFQVRRQDSRIAQSGRMRFATGQIEVRSRITLESEAFSYAVLHLGDHNLSGGVRPYQGEELFHEMREPLEAAFERADVPELLRAMERDFGPSWRARPGLLPAAVGEGGGTYSLRLLFRDEQRKVLDRVLESSREQAVAVYRQLYEQHAPLLRFLHGLRIPLPHHLEVAAQEALRLQMFQALGAAPLERTQLRLLAQEARAVGLDLSQDLDLGLAMGGALERLAREFQRQPDSTAALRELERTASLVQDLPFDTPLAAAQDICYTFLPQYQARLFDSSEAAIGWLESFERLANALRLRLPGANAAVEVS